MTDRKQKGNQGELEVIKRVRCPNCAGKLALIATNHPLIDTQCRFCVFQAQIKSVEADPDKHKTATKRLTRSQVIRPAPRRLPG